MEEQIGPVVSALVKMDPHTNESRGFGFVTFVNKTDFEKALSLANQEFCIDERKILINNANRDKPHVATPGVCKLN